MPSFEKIIDSQQRETVARISNRHGDEVTVKRSSEVFFEQGGDKTVMGTLRTNRSRLGRVEAREKEQPLFVYDVHRMDGRDYLFGPVGKNNEEDPDTICKTEVETRVLGAFAYVAEMDERRRPIRLAYEEVGEEEAEAVMEDIEAEPRKLPEYPTETDAKDRRPGEEDEFTFEQ